MPNDALLLTARTSTPARGLPPARAGQRPCSPQRSPELAGTRRRWVEQDGEANLGQPAAALQALEQAISPEQRRAVAACGASATQRETTLPLASPAAGHVPGAGDRLARTAAPPLCADWKRNGLGRWCGAHRLC